MSKYSENVIAGREKLLKRGFLVGCKLSYNSPFGPRVKYFFGLQQDKLLEDIKLSMSGISCFDERVDYLYYGDILGEGLSSADETEYRNMLDSYGLTMLRPMSHLNAVLVCLNEKSDTYILKNRLVEEGMICLEYTSYHDTNYLKFDERGNLLFM